MYSAGVAVLPLGNLDLEAACPVELPYLSGPWQIQGSGSRGLTWSLVKGLVVSDTGPQEPLTWPIVNTE